MERTSEAGHTTTEAFVSGALIDGRYMQIARLAANAFLTKDLQTGRDVVVKLLEADSHPAIRERFQRQARAALALEHPAIVRAFGSGEHEARPYLVCERLAGVHLDRRLLERPLDARELFQLALDIAGALTYAHEKGFAHGELEASHVLLRDDSRARARHHGSIAVLEGFGVQLPAVSEIEPSDEANGQRLQVERNDAAAAARLLTRVIAAQSKSLRRKSFVRKIRQVAEDFLANSPSVEQPANALLSAVVEAGRQRDLAARRRTLLISAALLCMVFALAGTLTPRLIEARRRAREAELVRTLYSATIYAQEKQLKATLHELELHPPRSRLELKRAFLALGPRVRPEFLKETVPTLSQQLTIPLPELAEKVAEYARLHPEPVEALVERLSPQILQALQTMVLRTPPTTDQLAEYQRARALGQTTVLVFSLPDCAACIEIERGLESALPTSRDAYAVIVVDCDMDPSPMEPVQNPLCERFLRNGNGMPYIVAVDANDTEIYTGASLTALRNALSRANPAPAQKTQ
jgi:hypothetical protein